MYAQLWHMGRAALESDLGHLPVSASSIAISGRSRNRFGEKDPHDVPRSLETHEIHDIINKIKNRVIILSLI